jgi:hypothetical protein
MKNRTSSKGKLPMYIPVRYFSLNPQTPNCVKNSSQIINMAPGIRIATHRYFHFLKNWLSDKN